MQSVDENKKNSDERRVGQRSIGMSFEDLVGRKYAREVNYDL